MLKIIIPLIRMLLLPSISKLFFHQIWILIFILTFVSLFLLPVNSFSLPLIINFSIDLMSIVLISLRLWISALIILARYKTQVENNSPKIFNCIIILLSIFLILTFSTNNFILFYTIFEASLIPTLLLIIGWGYQPERLRAGFYLILYTITASLPLLFGILLIYNNSFHLSILLFSYKFFVSTQSSISTLAWRLIIIAFLVKIPLYLVHLWLPKAHVEAPVAGSIVLAGILLKLGRYGLIRISIPFQIFLPSVAPLISSIALFGAFITGFICIRQHDLKSLIAYSSVGHIGLLTAGFFSSSIWGWSGSLALIIAHGLCSSCIFAIANIFYESTTTRRIYLTKGLIALFPAITFWFFIANAGNMAAPPSINLVSEIILLTRILSFSLRSWIIIGFARFLAAAYSLFLYTSTQHGSVPNFINPIKIFTQRNYSLCISHLLPLFILSLKAEIFSLWI